MVTNAEKPEAPTTTRQDLADRAASLKETTVRGSRTLLSGTPNGQVRRNLLYVAAVACIIIGYAPVALLPLLLLALTDAVVIE